MERDTVTFKAAKDLQRDICTREIVAFTPLLRRVRGAQTSSPVQPPEAAQSGGQSVGRSNSTFDRRLSSLRTQVSPARYADYEAIFRNTETLLRATSHKTSKKGASSLMDMCLRKVPDYVAGIKAWEIQEADENGTRTNTTGADVGPRIYSELESFGAFDSGWAKLRTVVEADTVVILAGALAEGLFPDEFSLLLLELCAEYGLCQTNILYEILLTRQYPEPTSSDSRFSEDSSLQPLSFLRDISGRKNKLSTLFQQLSNLLVQGLLPSTWLATREFEGFWASAYRVISKGRAALDAIDFLATSIVLLSKRQHLHSRQHADDLSLSCGRALNQALSLLSAMRRLGNGEAASGSDLKYERVGRICRSLDFTLHACISEIGSWKGRRGKPTYHLGLSAFLSTPELQNDRIDTLVIKAIGSMYDGLPNTTHHTVQTYNSVITLISGIAKICGRGTSQAARYHLAAMCKQLGRLALQPEALDDIKKAGAFFLAQESNNLRDLLYAEKLASSTSDNEVTEGRPRASGKPTLFDGFKWDETISEWVTISPRAQKIPPERRSLRSMVYEHPEQGMMPSIHLRKQSSTAPRLNGSILLAALPSANQEISKGTSSEKIGHENFILVNGKIGTSQTERPIESATLQHKHEKHPNKRHSCASATRGTLHHDELNDDKENRDKENRDRAMTRKRHSEGVRKPLGTKRRIRFSGSGLHSDDELGM
ncbi:hypothetical protein BKA67DRAFT_654269 [Truncatella angustata]|uniref:Uncharacterized protein n=1 Tax=Truncatella angustata TaxID=152316 RepID=A0A9P8V022_9PEZI|nr:uncharacterized protein BKA67DRAFT_654269 [Truncatella angustata]KAH6661131.1 hypothetical protein BKA67DRAFT_654269 [Truncatella angustata]